MADKIPAKLSDSLEDYLEAIFNISAGDNVARSKDIACALSVSRASVTGALKVLSERGLVNYKPYGYVTLTEAGAFAAAKVAGKHHIIKSFFMEVLGVDKSVAQEAACKAEHALGAEIISRLLSFIEFITQDNGAGPDAASRFRQFYKKSLHKKSDDSGAIRNGPQ